MSDTPTEKKPIALHPFIRRNLVAWTIRWSIGFSLLGWFTYYNPVMKWIWVPAILVAVFSFLLLFLIYFTMRAETGVLGAIRRFVSKVITGKW